MTRSARKSRSNAGPKTVMEDSFVAPRKPRQKEERVTLAEALAESGESIEELTAPPAEAERPTKEAGMSNLAQTIRAHRQNYTVALHPNGKKTQNNGDPIAKMLLNVSHEELMRFSQMKWQKSYDHLNIGHQRMCVGNLVRGAINKNEEDVLLWLKALQPDEVEAESEE